MRGRPDRARLMWLAPLLCALFTPAPAQGAKLIGGHAQQVIHRAFFAHHGHKGQVIVSIRASSVAPAWTVVKSVVPETVGTSTQRAIRPRSTFYRLSGGHARAGRPPAKARRDLSRDFRVGIVYAGSGSEKLSYEQAYRSVCAGGGGFVEQESDTVSPSWKVRYVVDLDRLQAAVRGPDGVDLAPQVQYRAPGSHLEATERRRRTYVDNGCFSKPTSYQCTTTFHLQSKGAGGDVAFDPGAGTEVGVPTRTSAKGDCDPTYYALGPSLWDEGAATALVTKLGLVNGGLPSRPYSALSVRWPGSSALEQAGFLTSPCQGLSTACHDRLSWKGTVRLQAVG